MIRNDFFSGIERRCARAGMTDDRYSFAMRLRCKERQLMAGPRPSIDRRQADVSCPASASFSRGAAGAAGGGGAAFD